MCACRGLSVIAGMTTSFAPTLNSSANETLWSECDLTCQSQRTPTQPVTRYTGLRVRSEPPPGHNVKHGALQPSTPCHIHKILQFERLKHSLSVFVALMTLPPVLATESIAPSAGSPSITQEFALICEQFRNGDDPYYGERRANALGQALAAETPDIPDLKRVGTRAQLAWERLKLGAPLEAVALLADASEMARDAGVGAASLRRLDAMRVIAHLQAAEDENCVGNESPGRCIVPVGPDGVHKLPRQARLAGDLSLAMLKDAGGGPSLRWSLNLARMVSGQYPGGVPEELRLPDDAFKSGTAFPHWPNRGSALGIDVIDLAGGAIMEDFDGDGLLDLVSSSSHPCGQMQAFRNLGNGRFEDVSTKWGLAEQLGGLNVIHADFDGDGHADLLVLRGGWLRQFGRVRNSLLKNSLARAGRFVDVTRAAGLAEPAYPTQTAAVADYDLDGDLDVYVGNEGSNASSPWPSQLFRNNGDGSFTDVASDAGVRNDRYTKAVAWGDYDNDGDPDLYVSTNNSDNRLYRNDGEKGFKDVAATSGVTQPDKRSFATWFFDYDNDGWLDLFVGNFENPPARVMASYFGAQDLGGAPHIYRNEQGKGFSDQSAALGLTRPLMPMGANYGDLDNDGWLDIYLGTGEPAFEAQVPNVMYRNVGGTRFNDVTFAGGFGHIQKGHGVAFGDLDNDGDQDLFHQIGGFYPGDAFGNALFENPGNGNAWLTLYLEGRRSNRFGVGARIRVTVSNDNSRRVIHTLAGSGGSFGGSSLRQEIGLGPAQSINAVEIDWPGGKRQVFEDLPLNATLRLTEGRPQAVIVETKAFTLATVPDPKQQKHHAH